MNSGGTLHRGVHDPACVFIAPLSPCGASLSHVWRRRTTTRDINLIRQLSLAQRETTAIVRLRRRLAPTKSELRPGSSRAVISPQHFPLSPTASPAARSFPRNESACYSVRRTRGYTRDDTRDVVQLQKRGDEESLLGVSPSTLTSAV